MSHDKTTPKVGTLLGGDEQRDAIHIAVAPLRAAEKMYPGDHISLNDRGEAVLLAPCIGIVDPFLTEAVEADVWFYCFLYPNTITSLRHEWTHPTFDAAQAAAKKHASAKWLREWCAHADLTYDQMVAIATKGEWRGEEEDGYPYRAYLDGEYIHCSGMDGHGDIPHEVWDHLEVVTGIKQTQRPTGFSCSC